MISFMYRSQFTLMICLQCGLYTGSLYIISWVSCFSLCRCKILVQCTVVHGWNHNCLVRGGFHNPEERNNNRKLANDAQPHNLAQPQLEMRFSGTGEGDGGTNEGVSFSIRHWQWRPLVQVNAPGDVNENGWLLLIPSVSYTWFNQPTWYVACERNQLSIKSLFS